MFTGSKWFPVHVPGPYEGTTEFTYSVKDASGKSDKAKVTVAVLPRGTPTPDKPELSTNAGIATDDFRMTNTRIGARVRVFRNDPGGQDLTLVSVNGKPAVEGERVAVANGEVSILPNKGGLYFQPRLGMQMDPLYLPPPEAVWTQLVDIAQQGYRGYTLAEHVGYSLFRVLAGFVFGCLIGIPLGMAMGLNDWLRGWFDPIVEFMRPVPPLALIPLVIIWFGINEEGKVTLLFLAALWIMTIAARAGVAGVNIAKVHAAYSLGASKWQILRRVIFPNALPELFTGARVAMGVGWGTVVAAELVAASQGAGQMIMVASKFQLTDIVLMGIIVIGVIGYAIDTLMRVAETYLVPWKGRA